MRTFRSGIGIDGDSASAGCLADRGRRDTEQRRQFDYIGRPQFDGDRSTDVAVTASPISASKSS